jgi:eukaryotic-like serine/threonine-protein kinase
MKACPRCSELYPDDSTVCVRDGTPLRKHVDPLVGKTIAQRYRLTSRIGAGRQGAVYLAKHSLLDRLSAVKILKPALAKDPAARGRFLLQARAVNRINHENIVEISDCGEADTIAYLVMEYVRGDSLATHLRNGPMQWPRVAAVGAQLAAALGRAHQMGVVIVDLRPQSLLLTKRADGTDLVKLVDFGHAELEGPRTRRPEPFPDPSVYMAPELLQASLFSPSSDLYSLGAVLYEALCGEPPRAAASRGAPPLEKRVPQLPTALVMAVKRLVADSPDARPRDAFIVREELAGLHPVAAHTGKAATASPPSMRAASERGPLEYPASSQPEEGRPPPGRRPTDAVPLANLENVCRERLKELEAVLLRGKTPAMAEIEANVREARRLVVAVGDAARSVLADQQRIVNFESKGVQIKRDFGRALDQLGVDAAHATGKAAEDLHYQMDTLRRRLEAESEAMESSLSEQRAVLEGHIGALRALAAEAWYTLASLAASMGVPFDPLPQKRGPYD